MRFNRWNKNDDENNTKIIQNILEREQTLDGK